MENNVDHNGNTGGNKLSNDTTFSSSYSDLSRISISKSMVLKYLEAMRPWSLSASFTPVTLGCVLAYKSTGIFNFWIYLSTCLTVLSVHAAGNLVNTYFDYVKGVDGKQSDDRTLVDRVLSTREVEALCGFLYFSGFIGLVSVVTLSPGKGEYLGLIFTCGFLSSFMYTGWLQLKYIALGDMLIILTFGPIVVTFSFIAQAGYFTMTPFLYAIPLALNTEAILHSNNTRDMEEDKRSGIQTLAILLGKELSYILFLFLLFSPYIVFTLLARFCSKWLFLPVLTILEAFTQEERFRTGQLTTIPQDIAKLNLLLGLLFVVGCLLSGNGCLL